ncbi:hypothetical protein STEG23_036977, partial [Scotinomys teguina]
SLIVYGMATLKSLDARLQYCCCHIAVGSVVITAFITSGLPTSLWLLQLPLPLPLLYCSTAPLPLPPPLLHCPTAAATATAPLPHCRCFTAPLPHCRCFTAPLPHCRCFTAPLLHCSAALLLWFLPSRY